MLVFEYQTQSEDPVRLWVNFGLGASIARQAALPPILVSSLSKELHKSHHATPFIRMLQRARMLHLAPSQIMASHLCPKVMVSPPK